MECLCWIGNREVAVNGLAQFRSATALSEANGYTARREPRTPGIAKTRLAEIINWKPVIVRQFLGERLGVVRIGE